MKQIVAAALISLSFAMPAAFAQTAAPAAAQVDPAATAAVKELIEVMKMREMMQMSFKQMQQSMPQFMMQGASAAINANPKLNAAQKKAAIAQAEKELPQAAQAVADTMNDPKMLDELMAEMTPLYTKYYNAEELRAMTAFYRSPVGAKMLTTMPQVMGESMQISQRVVMPRMMAMIEKLAQGKK
jgi:uncharacterized protein